MNDGNIDNMLTGVTDPGTQRVLKSLFRYLLGGAIRFGRATSGDAQSQASTQVAAKALGGGFYHTTTPSVANQEFALSHSFGHAPYLLIPLVPLDQAGAAIVRLTVSRPADASNVYLKSPETSQPIYVYLEG
jgi:hypothetical protein